MIFIKVLIIFFAYLFNINVFDGISIKKQTLNSLSFDIYTKIQSEAQPKKVLLLVHGFTTDGNKDAELVKLAKSLAFANITVMVPDIPGLKDSQIGYDEIKECAQAVDAMNKLYPSSRKGVFSFCFSNGPLIAALKEQNFKGIDYIVLWGSYSDLLRTAKFNLTGYYSGSDKTIYSDPDKEVVNLYYKQKYWYNAFPANRRAKAMGGVIVNYPKALNTQEKPVLEFLRNQDPRFFNKLFNKLPASVSAWVEYMSVLKNLNTYKGDIVFFHSKYDSIVPFQESVELFSKSNARSKYIFLPAIFEHFQEINIAELRKLKFSEGLSGLKIYFEFLLKVVTL